MPFDSLAPNYAEARTWFVYLNTFTATDLADDMAIHPELASRFIVAGLWHGIIEDTGDSINGRGPRESIYRYVPLPAGPREHPTRPPEWRSTPGCYELARATGMAVRIRSDRDSRRLLSTPGARHKMKLREQRYREQEQARMDMMEAMRKKEAKPPKWMRKKKKSVVV
jgi:hypothetical protein